MSIINKFRDILEKSFLLLSEEKNIPLSSGLDTISIEVPRDPTHGDLATNAAMVIAKMNNSNPIEFATSISQSLKSYDIFKRVEVAGPGFINVIFQDNVWHSELESILNDGKNWGNSTLGINKTVNVEYVSANPTGPLHIGHVRGAVLGDVIANLLKKIGYQVTREYYVNDAGKQIDNLAKSVYFRYKKELGINAGDIPDGYYPGEYLKELAIDLINLDGNKWEVASKDLWLPFIRNFSVNKLMHIIQEDLNKLGIKHDIFFYESDLHKKRKIEKCIQKLKEKKYIYEGILPPPKGKDIEEWKMRNQVLFRATRFGDDIDRPLMKSDGSYTYFAADIAYHNEKLLRNYSKIIDIWGADHGGYIKRVKAALVALSDKEIFFDVKICNLVKLTKNGKPIKMSKRSGDFVTLNDLLNEVGSDVVRFMMLTQKPESQLDFDLNKVLQKNSENPVFYVQYAHARICSLMRKASEAFPKEIFNFKLLQANNFSELNNENEIELIRKLSCWPGTVISAANASEPHRITYYLYELANLFHSYWNNGITNKQNRFIIENDLSLTTARLALCSGIANVLVSGFEILGVEPVKEML